MNKFNLFFSSLLLSFNCYATESIALDLSPETLYHNAQPLVQCIILLLLGCSVITWTIALFKSIQIGFSRKQLNTTQRQLTHLTSMSTLLDNQPKFCPIVHKMLTDSQAEIALSRPYFNQQLQQRITQRLTQLSLQELQQKRVGIGLLATIGSVSPFIGLFGTVWGIMNSFVGIAQTQTTDLYAVAPGIAEALFATALGLVAAIPAVVLYNLLINCLKNYHLLLNQIEQHIQLAVARDISLNQLG